MQLDINTQSRYGSGVRVMRLAEGDKVAVVARVDRDNEAETAQIDNEGETDPTPEELAAIEPKNSPRKPPRRAHRATRNKRGLCYFL